MLRDDRRRNQIGAARASEAESIPRVYVLERDVTISRHIAVLLRGAGYDVRVVDTPAEVEAGQNESAAMACSILDYRLGESFGFGNGAGWPSIGATPLILLSQVPDLRTAVKAIRAGAFDFLPKPVNGYDLIEVVACAIHEATRRWTDTCLEGQLRKNYARLTPREREVLSYVIQGLRNKQTAQILGTSEVTIRIHRGQIMRKMAAKSLTDLVKSAFLIGVCQMPKKNAFHPNSISDSYLRRGESDPASL